MQAAGGVNRYFANIVSRLPESYTPYVIVSQTREVNFPVHPKLKVFNYGRLPLGHLSQRLGKLCSAFEKRYIENINIFHHINVVHPTYYSLLTKRDVKRYRCPVVITVYDMIHELFLKDKAGADLAIEEKRRAIMAAQAIICISENTKKDLLELYPVAESKVRVTPLASEINASLSYGSEPVPSRPYYLYVGSRDSYKNFDGLLSAFAQASAARPDVVLCVVGKPFAEAEEKLIAELKLTKRIEHYQHPNDRHLAKLYRCSVAFVYPSLYEGFGIPPLEAMACGTVVVAADCASIPEVVGDAGLLFNPRATSDLADILLHLLDNPAERERLIALGSQRVQVFSWDQTVAQTIDVYRSLYD